MSKTKISMVEDMRITLTEMSEIFEWADIEAALAAPSRAEELKVGFIRSGYKWLYDIVYPAFKEVMEIWKLLPREQWERYKRWGEFNEHRESRLLDERLLRLRKIVRAKTRPDFFKRGKINAQIKALDKKRDRSGNSKSKKRVPKTK